MKCIAKIWNMIYDGHRGLALSGALYVLLAIFFILQQQWDERILNGVNIWLKPTKFAISLVVFNWTLALILPLYPYSTTKRKRLGDLVTWLMVVEIGIIWLQAWRGKLSHFNMSTPLDQTLFQIMAASITVVLLIAGLLAVDAFHKKLRASEAMVWSLRFAWISVLIAGMGGFMMGSALQHSVGIPDGGEGLPFLNWSREGGDLRVMHFFGLHAIQLLPLATYGLKRMGLKQPGHLKKATIAISLCYLTFVLYTFIQALGGKGFLEMLLLP
ncbi:MAG: hypothetical protein AAF990_13565 [Bacteroidota bacterium]